MSADFIADLLTRIRNAQRVGHRSVRTRHSRVVEQVLSVLRTEGFIDGFQVAPSKVNKLFKECEVVLRYYETGEPLISVANRYSKSGRRVYRGSDNLPTIRSGLGISIISTSQGIMSDKEAKKRRIGGEVLAIIG
jgi:small subunit ribosomal protein S8